MSSLDHAGRHRQSRSTPTLSATPFLIGLVILALALALSGYREVEAAEAEVYTPATLEEVADLDVKRVTFTEEGAARVDLATAVAQASGSHVAVPYAALIYDGQGVSWVYAAAQPLTFLRTQVVVDRIEGDQALLSEGLPPGTSVVTVGATEVYGAELGIEGGH